MNLERFARLPKRIRQDLKIIRLTKNWREILDKKSKGQSYDSIHFRNGVILNSPPEVSLDFLFHEIWLDEFYSPAGYEIRPGQTVVDIGANIGVFALYAATKARDVTVSSYEPHPATAEFFLANCLASNVANVQFHPVAVGDSVGKRVLTIAESWMLNSLSEKDTEVNGCLVDCISLDRVLDNIVKCDLLKLDCEGGEYEILYSASPETFEKISRIVCEYNVLDGERRNGMSLRDFLQKRGFVVEKTEPLDETSGFICAKKPVIA